MKDRERQPELFGRDSRFRRMSLLDLWREMGEIGRRVYAEQCKYLAEEEMKRKAANPRRRQDADETA